MAILSLTASSLISLTVLFLVAPLLGLGGFDSDGR